MQSMGYMISILVMSFLGSWHCALMCGPIAAHIGVKGRTSLYQLGRMISYSSVGALFGWIGTRLFNPENRVIFLVSLSFFFFILFSSALARLKWIRTEQLWHKKFENRLKKFIFANFQFRPQGSSFFAGLLTGFLPCGWLFTFYSAASLTKSPFSGALVLFVFWLGSLPSLVTISEFLRSSLLKTSERQQKISGALLLASSFYALVSHIYTSGILN